MNKRSYYLVSLGCAKNTVDSESMAALLEEDGYVPARRASQAGVLIVNTCGFIKPAIDESIQMLQELASAKKPGQLLVAAGCLTQRYSQMVAEQVSGLDGILGTRRWMDIVDLVHELERVRPAAPRYDLPDTPTIGRDEHNVLRASIQGSSAYLKIADGCRRPCAFCAIPLIKGTLVSRPLETIIQEARQLQTVGLQELILIAQDSTDYGHDLGMKDGLTQLLKRMLPEIPDLPWIRILYAFPGYVTDSLIDLMASEPQMLHYLDIPLQHADPGLLYKMRRPSNMDWVRKTIRKMRAAMPDLALRTTFIVGYPGEGEAEFNALLDFVREVEFDRIGVFTYSFEAGTGAESLGDTVPTEVKEERRERLMLAQQEISLRKNQAFIGTRQDVLVEGFNDGISVGRSYRDAPEIDGLVFIEGKCDVGKITPVQISGALSYDLTAQPVIANVRRTLLQR